MVPQSVVGYVVMFIVMVQSSDGGPHYRNQTRLKCELKGLNRRLSCIGPFNIEIIVIAVDWTRDISGQDVLLLVLQLCDSSRRALDSLTVRLQIALLVSTSLLYLAATSSLF
jgi:hypothetical protein